MKLLNRLASDRWAVRQWLAAFGLGMGLPLLTSCSGPKLEMRAYRIVFSQNSTDNPWRRAMLAGMQRELIFHPEVQFRMLDAGGSSQRQQAQIRALASGEVDLLIVSPNETVPLTAAVEETYERGVPVLLLLLDRRVNSRRYTAFVGGSNLEVGRTAARYAASLLRRQGDQRQRQRNGSTGARSRKRSRRR